LNQEHEELEEEKQEGSDQEVSDDQVPASESSGVEVSEEDIEIIEGDDGLDLEVEYEALNDRYLRLAAEYDNYRKRTTREKHDSAKYASARIIEKLLPVLDTITRGVAFNQNAESIESVKEGLEKVQRLFGEVLTNEGLEEIADTQVPLDLNQHMAVFQEETDQVPDGTVLEVFEKGYRLKDRVLRPAKVKVAKNDNSSSASGEDKLDETTTGSESENIEE